MPIIFCREVDSETFWYVLFLQTFFVANVNVRSLDQCVNFLSFAWFVTNDKFLVKMPQFSSSISKIVLAGAGNTYIGTNN
jgi:hypothetical protein